MTWWGVIGQVTLTASATPTVTWTSTLFSYSKDEEEPLHAMLAYAYRQPHGANNLTYTNTLDPAPSILLKHATLGDRRMFRDVILPQYSSKVFPMNIPPGTTVVVEGIVKRPVTNPHPVRLYISLFVPR